jgi:GTP-binding protein
MVIKSAEFVKGIVGTNPILYDGLPQVAFIGRSNVGKSSLLNALVNRKELVKVSGRPGKTTELNFFLINKNLYFVDLPGFGYAKLGEKQREKLRKLILWYFMYAEVNPVVVIVLDISAGLTSFDQEMIEVLEEQNHPYLIAVNKIDKLNQAELAKQVKAIQSAVPGIDIVLCSAKEKKNINILLKKIESLLKI